MLVCVVWCLASKLLPIVLPCGFKCGIWDFLVISILMQRSRLYPMDLWVGGTRWQCGAAEAYCLRLLNNNNWRPSESDGALVLYKEDKSKLQWINTQHQIWTVVLQMLVSGVTVWDLFSFSSKKWHWQKKLEFWFFCFCYFICTQMSKFEMEQYRQPIKPINWIIIFIINCDLASHHLPECFNVCVCVC